MPCRRKIPYYTKQILILLSSVFADFAKSLNLMVVILRKPQIQRWSFCEISKFNRSGFAEWLNVTVVILRIRSIQPWLCPNLPHIILEIIPLLESASGEHHKWHYLSRPLHRFQKLRFFAVISQNLATLTKVKLVKAFRWVWPLLFRETKNFVSENILRRTRQSRFHRSKHIWFSTNCRGLIAVNISKSFC